jgi:hypothetical protein
MKGVMSFIRVFPVHKPLKHESWDKTKWFMMRLSVHNPPKHKSWDKAKWLGVAPSSIFSVLRRGSGVKLQEGGCEAYNCFPMFLQRPYVPVEMLGSKYKTLRYQEEVLKQDFGKWIW